MNGVVTTAARLDPGARKSQPAEPSGTDRRDGTIVKIPPISDVRMLPRTIVPATFQNAFDATRQERPRAAGPRRASTTRTDGPKSHRMYRATVNPIAATITSIMRGGAPAARNSAEKPNAATQTAPIARMPRRSTHRIDAKWWTANAYTGATAGSSPR